jgi:long-chain acyl-CoA synthetase
MSPHGAAVSDGKPLAGYKRPTSITVIDAIPKNAVGKADKAPLRAAHRRGTSP